MKTKARLSNDEIVNESGKTWQQWFSELNTKGFNCHAWNEQIDSLISDYQLDRSTAEHIAKAYCKECELPWKTKQNRGFEISVSKTVPYEFGRVMGLTKDWFEKENRAIFREQCNGSKVRYQWKTDNSEVAIRLEKKGSDKTRMVVQHDQLGSSLDAEIMRNFWKSHLRSMVESF